MFCHQCEQTANGSGCHKVGVCGKQPDVAALQDNLMHGLQGLGFFAHKARKLGATDGVFDPFFIEGLFATVTNVDFDPQRLTQLIAECGEYKKRAQGLYEAAFRKANGIPARVLETGAPAW